MLPVIVGIVVVIVVLLVVGIAMWRSDRYPYFLKWTFVNNGLATRREMIFRWWFYRDRRVEGCVNFSCRMDRRHEECMVCFGKTCGRRMWIDPVTLQRKRRPVCDNHTYERQGSAMKRQSQLERERRLQDMEKITVPPVDNHVRYEVMPDQYTGPTRDAIRAFFSSEATEAVIDGISASTLNQSLRSVGLHNEAYAETRNEETVLRKTPNGSGKVSSK